MMSRIMSVETLRYPLMLLGAALGVAITMGATLTAGIEWSWSPLRDLVPFALLCFTGLMLLNLAEAVDGIDGRIAPTVVSGIALAAGVFFLIEPSVTLSLRPLVTYRPLPSLIFASSAGVLAASVMFCATRRKAGILLERRNAFLSFLRNGAIYVGVFLVLLVAHFLWLDGCAQFDRAIRHDSGVDLSAMVIQTFVPLITTGALVGYCFHTALAGPPTAYGAAFNDPTASEWPHIYSWIDHAPRRPFRTWHQERSGTVLPVLAIFTLAGLVVGYYLWPQQWVGSALSCAALGALAASGYAGIIHWTYRHTDPSELVTTFVSRHAFIRKTGDQTNFVVVEENGTLTGKIQIERPWREVQEFSKDRYAAVFGATHQRGETDWNVIKLVLTKGPPLLVSETFDGDGVVYENLSRLTEVFGPAAREHYFNAHSEPSLQSVSPDSVPETL